jgi:UDP-2,3-diacylglucosamine pyrophosphatase LpxH
MGREYEGVADAQVLISGHYHHTNLRSQQGRHLFICPSLMAVGDWWANATGMRSDPGTLTFVIGADGWSNLEVLRCPKNRR